MKAGTTSLHYYLKSHPKIFLPLEKEVPVFALDELYDRGMDWYLKEFFAKARDDQLWGTVSPQYMINPKVPERMHSYCPDAKLIALLRDPIDRARSQYKMNVRAFGERRPLEQALDEQYSTCGYYGKVLSDYLRLFPRENLLVVYSKDFDIDPMAVAARICRFLGVDPGLLRPPTSRHNVATNANAKPLLRIAANIIHYRSHRLKPVIRKLVPERYTRRLGKWSILYRSNVKDVNAIDVSLSPQALQLLAKRFLADAEILRTITGELPPWHGRLVSLLKPEEPSATGVSGTPGG